MSHLVCYTTRMKTIKNDTKNKDKKHWIGRTGPKVKNNIAPKRFHPRRKYCEANQEN